MATPVILGAGVLEVPKLPNEQGGLRNISGLAAIAGQAAGLTAYASVAVLMRYFERHDFEALDSFAYYCMAAQTLALAVLIYAG